VTNNVVRKNNHPILRWPFKGRAGWLQGVGQTQFTPAKIRKFLTVCVCHIS